MHLIWDWNGTLLDDYHLTVEASNAAFASVGGEPVDPEDHRRRFRRPVQDYYAEVLGRPLPDDEFALLDRVYHETYHARMADCLLAAGAEEALAGWSGTQSLLSMWFHERLVPFVDGFGLTDHFVRIDGLRDRVGGGNKAEHAMRHLAAIGIPGSQCVMIGDTLDDAAAAAAVGAGCVLISGGFTDADRLAATGLPLAHNLADAVALAADVDPSMSRRH
ncbi:HAD family hydrolase [Microlunatus soli]|uniref:Phosphoglycolate phosphatase, HAD superfamily n=1 Tax=Microlunatus soli TaxID=630515 RepID=A0A1H1QWD9_9ACTN|nr:HAD family hydrolase [Microlunatus soli]SDS27778.1 Phosphoglycolate phosphatase, HAD superfamily [Microlunatus soli]